MKIKGFTAAPICALLMVIIGGCGASPPSDFFIMTPMTEADTRPAVPPPDGSLSLVVGPVSIPEYLNRTQIVTRAGTNRLNVNEFNRWGGSFTPNISRVVAQNLSAILGTDDVFVFPAEDTLSPRYRIILSLTQFDGALGDSVVLDTRWVITTPRSKNPPATGRTIAKESTNGGSYEDYVAAQSRALAKLSQDIAAKIKVLLAAEK